MENEITVRALNTDDLFTLIDIASDLNTDALIDEIVDLQGKEKEKLKSLKKGKELNQSEIDKLNKLVSAKAILVFLKNIGNAKDKVYQLLSDVSGIPKDKIGTSGILTTVTIINKIIQQKEFNDFFKQITEK